MTTIPPRRVDFAAVRRLFDRVCDLAPDQRQHRYTDERLDADLVAEVESLLASDAAGHTALKAPVVQALGALPETELGEGERLGAWRLLGRLGRGGMGAVHLAERADGHFRQQAAIKLIRGLPGADTLAHFARERQILASLQHPNIARLLDGGATPGGQPYLVMEYVEGVPIDEYCRAHALSLAARLDLFRTVCAAVQFAHQRLIVHCDLKPSNVLVRGDGAPALLDFGIARVQDSIGGADDSGVHAFTPGYASPEQQAGEAVTTASDVYALGVLLFELVSGRKARMDGADDTVGQLGRAQIRPSQLAIEVPWRTRLAGDLDAIVLHACAAQPGDRYASVQALADDVRRFLARRTVLARPQTVAYRASRWLRRHRPLASAVAAALLLSVAFTWRLARESERARAAEHEAKQQAATAQHVSDFLVSAFNFSNPAVHARGRDVSARDVLDQGAERIGKELADTPRVKARLEDVLATAYRYLGAPQESVELFKRAIDGYLDPSVGDPLAAAEGLSQLAIVYSNNEYPLTDAEAAARRALTLREQYAPDDLLLAADSWNTLGVVLDKQGRYEDAEAALQKAMDIRGARADVPKADLAATLHNLARSVSHRGRYAQALGLFDKALALKRASVGEHHPSYQTTLQGYATALGLSGQRERALPLLQQNLALCRELYGESSENTGSAHNQLAYVLHDLGRFAEAIEHYRQAMHIDAAVLGADSASAAVPLNNLASAYEDLGDDAAALPLYERSLAIRSRKLAADNPRVLLAQYRLANLLVKMNRLDAAHASLEVALDGYRAQRGEDDAMTAKCELALAEWQLARGDIDGATRTSALLANSRAVFAPQMRARHAAIDARIALAHDDIATALERRRDAYETMRNGLGERHPLVAEPALAYADALARTGQAREAEALVAEWRAPVDATFAAEAPVRKALARWR